MKRVTKGALAMVLAGSVTFSVANAMLDNSLTKQLVKENPFRITADRKKADIINQAAKKNIAQKPTANGKDHDITAVVQKNIEKSSSRTTTNPANTNVKTTIKPAATSIPVKSTKAPTTTSKSTTTRTAATTRPTASATTKPVATTKPATSTKAPTKTSKPVTTTPTKTTTTTTKTNRGQQVSQAAKEAAETRRDTKENNGKKM